MTGIKIYETESSGNGTEFKIYETRIKIYETESSDNGTGFKIHVTETSDNGTEFKLFVMVGLSGLSCLRDSAYSFEPVRRLLRSALKAARDARNDDGGCGSFEVELK